MHLNIDGYPSDSPDSTQFFGTEVGKLGITLLLLQDTIQRYGINAKCRHREVTATTQTKPQQGTVAVETLGTHQRNTEHFVLQ